MTNITTAAGVLPWAPISRPALKRVSGWVGLRHSGS